jgi:hypothetical protein
MAEFLPEFLVLEIFESVFIGKVQEKGWKHTKGMITSQSE